MTGSNWGGLDYASETGNSTYFLWRWEGTDGGSSNPNIFSYDWIPMGHYKSLNAGSSAEACFAFGDVSTKTLRLTSFKYGGDIHA
jgi:hypothetical protein